MQPIKKQKRPTFESFECQCDIDLNSIPLQIKNATFLSCILKNYKKYLTSRNMIGNFAEQYMKDIDYNINYPDENVKILQLVTNVKDVNKAMLINKEKIKLYLLNYSTDNYKRFLIATDVFNSEEFVNFVNTHVFCNDMDELFKEYKDTSNEIKRTNFIR